MKNNTIKPNNKDPEEGIFTAANLAMAADAASVIGGAASLIGYFTTRNQNRKIIGKLEDIQKYLKMMDNKIDDLINSNRTILDKIDQLPEKIRVIVIEVVDKALLTERYTSLTRIKNNYFLLPGGQSLYLINTTRWDELSDILTYLFLHENRLSFSFSLISSCDFALAVTYYQAFPVMIELIERKISLIQKLYVNVERCLNESINSLYLKLVNKEFVRTHNFSAQLESINSLKFDEIEDRITKEEYIEKSCHLEGYGSGAYREVCYPVKRTRTIQANVNYNKQKKAFLSSIVNDTENLKVSLFNFIEVKEFLKVFVEYKSNIFTEYKKINTNNIPKLPVPGSAKSKDYFGLVSHRK